MATKLNACANNRKSFYGVKNHKKPNIAGIQELGATAYVKDLKASKLDARAKKGRFVGYNSESRGHQIYWPDKWSITVGKNVIFNEDNVLNPNEVTTIYSEAQSEGENEKVIQAPQNDAVDSNEPETKEFNDQQTKEKESTPHQNSIQFPSSQPQLEPNTMNNDDEHQSEQQYGHKQRCRHPQGTYKAMNEGLIATVILNNNTEADKVPEETVAKEEMFEDVDEDFNC